MKTKLQSSLKEAMKAKDKVRLETIRALMSAITYEEIEKKSDPLPEDQCLAILQREVKKRREEIEFAEKAGRPELLDKLEQEIATIETFLPKQLSASELEKIIGDLKQNTPGLSLGVAMKSLKESYGGQYDSKLASDIAKRVCG